MGAVLAICGSEPGLPLSPGLYRLYPQGLVCFPVMLLKARPAPLCALNRNPPRRYGCRASAKAATARCLCRRHQSDLQGAVLVPRCCPLTGIGSQQNGRSSRSADWGPGAVEVEAKAEVPSLFFPQEVHSQGCPALCPGFHPGLWALSGPKVQRLGLPGEHQLPLQPSSARCLLQGQFQLPGSVALTESISDTEFYRPSLWEGAEQCLPPQTIAPEGLTLGMSCCELVSCPLCTVPSGGIWAF